MTYAVLMAALDLDLPSRGALAASVKLARMFEARTIGVAAAECTISPYFAEGPIAGQFIANAKSELRLQLKTMEGEFRRAYAAHGDTTEWRCAERLPDGFIIELARAADLIVVGRPQPSSNLMRGPDVANVLMQAGRPVLVVPPDQAEFAAERILVAWKDTREARRAVSDALPILRKAREVRVVAVHEPETNDAATLSGADDVVNWLARHAVKSVASVQPDYGNVGRSIEASAAEAGADLIVAGAFGHSRFMEWMLSGVTRHLLSTPNISVLFSH